MSPERKHEKDAYPRGHASFLVLGDYTFKNTLLNSL